MLQIYHCVQLNAVCCRWCNVETSSHKHFAIVSRHQQTLPLTTSEVSQLAARWSDGVILTTPASSSVNNTQ